MHDFATAIPGPPAQSAVTETRSSPSTHPTNTMFMVLGTRTFFDCNESLMFRNDNIMLLCCVSGEIVSEIAAVPHKMFLKNPCHAFCLDEMTARLTL
jgi:hypothetical protein